MLDTLRKVGLSTFVEGEADRALHVPQLSRRTDNGDRSFTKLPLLQISGGRAVTWCVFMGGPFLYAHIQLLASSVAFFVPSRQLWHQNLAITFRMPVFGRMEKPAFGLYSGGTWPVPARGDTMTPFSDDA